MNRILSAVFALLISTGVSAQIQSTPNLIDPAGAAWGIPSNQVLNTGQISQIEGAGYTTGTAYYNSSTNTIRFGYLPSTVAQTIAINQALSGTGIQINGFNWSYQWMNGGESSGSLGVAILLSDPMGSTLESQVMSHTKQQTASWNLEQGTKTFTNPYALISTGYLSMSISGQDDKFWMGLYGPRVRDVSLGLNYSTDPCAADPLSSPDCPGYQQAYFTQQCTANPLYDSACPGYAAAYHNQQCLINPLYATTCPGYQQAYHDIVLAATRSAATEESASTQIAQADTSLVTEPSATSTTSPTSVSPVAVVSVINPAARAAPAVTTQSAKSDKARAEAKATEQKKTEQAVSRAIPRGATGTAAAKAAADKAGEAVADAAATTTIEAQQAAQNLAMGLMGFNPAFSAYQNAIVPDVNAATMARQYNQPTVDNRSALRQLSGASDRLHQDMVDQQYGRMPR